MSDLSFFQKPVSQLKYSDIEWLVNEERMPESYNLDYKRDNYERNKTDELAKDISALANTSGGWLVLGVEEDKNSNEGETYPGEIVGIENEKDIKKRITDRIINSIMPHPQVQFSSLIEIPDKKNRAVLVVYVPKSFDSLHMVVVKHKNRYYKRYHDQNVPMDEYEVRTRYEMIGKGEKYLDDRLAKNSNEALKQLHPDEKGAIAVSVVSAFADLKCRDLNLVNSLVHNPNERCDPRILIMGIGGSCAPQRKMDCIQKINDRERTSAVMRFYFDGAISYATSRIFGLGQDGQERRLYSHDVVYEIFHIMSIFADYYIKNGYFGYIKIRIDIKDLPKSRFVFRCNDDLFLANHSIEFDRPFLPVIKRIQVPDLLEQRKNLADECLLPLFYEAGLDETHLARYCWDSNNQPLR